MPLSKQNMERNYYGRGYYSLSQNSPYYAKQQYNQNANVTDINRFRARQKPKRKLNGKGKIAIFIMFLFFTFAVTPFFLRNITRPILFGQTFNSKVKPADYNILYNPTLSYLYNTDYMNQKNLIGVSKKPLMQSIYATNELTELKNILLTQINSYPNLDASIFVWDTSNGNYVDIKGDKTYSSASIIKIPVLISLFKAIESGKFNKTDKMSLEEYYRSEGSGSLQYSAGGTELTIDDLARLMITESDNSSTNMLMSAIGSMTAVNDDIKRWGLKNTHINTWLPDLNGTNYTTTKDLATMLHNLDNEAFLTLESRADIFDYMGHVKNNRLLAAGIPPEASIAHKTGDIGTSLGDAGIIYSPNGRKYIAAIMVNRPHNDPRAKELIVDASKTIYNYMTNY